MASLVDALFSHRIGDSTLEELLDLVEKVKKQFEDYPELLEGIDEALRETLETIGGIYSGWKEVDNQI
ncbi:MAG: hypothetical protein COY80_03485 [Candidatus Pacebacteria bacterium CG_4_10_14_0_8_um_filter_42_14]|nr:MAG: hypothetical protein COY80_03485 [Candidatus Pacebacteria bacterium CG_4_10_14_0_8_um_filter_42_14]